MRSIQMRQSRPRWSVAGHTCHPPSQEGSLDYILTGVSEGACGAGKAVWVSDVRTAEYGFLRAIIDFIAFYLVSSVGVG